MAKQIKAIKCPQCGSTQKTQVKDDYYRCNNCGTEYFLDNDDINVNVNHNVNRPVSNTNTVKIVVAVCSFLAIVFFFSIFTSLCSRPKKTKSYGTYSVGTTEKKENPNAHRNTYKLTELIAEGNKVFVFSLVDKVYGSRRGTEKDGRSGLYYAFYEPASGKIVKESPIDMQDQMMDNYDYRYFPGTGKHYIILKKRFIYEINPVDLSFSDVTTEIFKTQSQFESGIASAEFISKGSGEGFKVMTNMGKSYYYCPGVNKVYNHDGYYSKAHEFNTLLPGARDITYYAFTRKSDDYPDEILQLLRITYKYNNGGPEDKLTRPSWRKHYAQWGIIYDNTPYKKMLIDKPWHRVTDYKDITPGRMYFSPGILYQDKDNILITFKANAAPDAPLSLQLLTTNGEIVWTTASEKSFESNSAAKNDKYFISKTNRDILYLISLDGKSIKQVELPKGEE